MKYVLLIIVQYVLITNSFAIEYKSKLVCKDNNCEKKQEFKGLKEPELKLTDLAAGQCLIDLKTEKISKIESLNPEFQKVTTLSEKSDLTTTTELSREVTWFNTKSFNRSQKIIPCKEVAGVLGDEERLSKCLS
ncbi:MAG: hypothetical protein EHM20_16250, partial [Alphaproteobacteria bacterium]